jgi:hypothetical protein
MASDASGEGLQYDSMRTGRVGAKAAFDAAASGQAGVRVARRRLGPENAHSSMTGTVLYWKAGSGASEAFESESSSDRPRLRATLRSPV